MSREFKPEVTVGMVVAAFERSGVSTSDMISAALAHPDFRRQLRKWAAEEMRGLVADDADDEAYLFDCANRRGYNACRAETLANIEAWEKQP